MPKLSLIMPAYNAEATCKAAIESAIGNQYDFELLVIDDGSKDATSEICGEMQRRDPRIRVYTKENGGVSSARNMGLRLALGEYIGFLDADDTLTEDYMDVIFPLLEQEPDVIVFGYQIMKGGRQVASSFMSETRDVEALWKAMLGPDGGLNPPWNKIYKKSLITEEFNTSKQMGEDLEFCCAYLKNIRSCIVIGDLLYRYRADSEGSLTRKLDIVLRSVAQDMEVVSDFTQAVGADSAILADRLYQRTEGILGNCADYGQYRTAVDFFGNDRAYRQLLAAWKPRKAKNRFLRGLLIKERRNILFVYLRCKRLARRMIRKW